MMLWQLLPRARAWARGLLRAEERPLLRPMGQKQLRPTAPSSDALCP